MSQTSDHYDNDTPKIKTSRRGAVQGQEIDMPARQGTEGTTLGKDKSKRPIDFAVLAKAENVDWTGLLSELQDWDEVAAYYQAKYTNEARSQQATEQSRAEGPEIEHRRVNHLMHTAEENLADTNSWGAQDVNPNSWAVQEAPQLQQNDDGLGQAVAVTAPVLEISRPKHSNSVLEQQLLSNAFSQWVACSAAGVNSVIGSAPGNADLHNNKNELHEAQNLVKAFGGLFLDRNNADRWNTDEGGDWESLTGDDSASNYYPGKPNKRITRGVPAEEETLWKESLSEEVNTAKEHTQDKQAAVKAEHKENRHEERTENVPKALKLSLFDANAPLSDGLPYESYAIEKLAGRVQQPLNYPYEQNCCLLLCWEEDVVMVGPRVKRLKALFIEKYAASTAEFRVIPHTDSHHVVMNEIETFVYEHSQHATLITVYYCGGATKTANHGLAFFPLENAILPNRAEYDYPKVFWELPQRHLEETESDVLILLDTCGRYGDPPSASSIHKKGQGKTELIASLEFESFDMPYMSFSFTDSLIRELSIMYDMQKVFSAADLHRAMINRSNRSRVPKRETEVVPFFMKLNGQPQDCSILLRPRKAAKILPFATNDAEPSGT